MRKKIFSSSWFSGLIVLITLITVGIMFPPVAAIILLMLTFLSGIFILIGLPAPIFFTMIIIYFAIVILIRSLRKKIP